MAAHPLAALALASLLAAPAEPQFLPPLKQQLLVPSYWAPCHDPSDPRHGPMDCDWDQVLSDNASHNFSAIGAVVLNPSSGPGGGCDSGYANLTARLRAADAHIGVLGYVYTQYGARPVSDVLADVDR